MSSIRQRLLWWVLGAMGGGALLLAATTYVLTLNELNEVFDEHLKQVAQAVGASLPPGQAMDGAAAYAVPDPDAEAGDFDFHTAVYTRQGRLVFSSHAEVTLPLSAQAGASQLTLHDARWFVYSVFTADHVVQVAQPASARQELALDAALQGVAMLLALMAAIAVLLVWAMRRALAPLDEAAAGVASRSATSLQPVDDSGLPAELRPLVGAINALLQRLSVAFTRQQRFVADAAHELRTPMTALQLQLQLLEQAPNEAERAFAVAELRGGIQRAQRLVQQLLALSRAEPEVNDTPLQPLELGAVVQEVVKQRSIEASDRNICLRADAAADCRAAANREQMAVLLGNLVDNALRHTPAGGTVQVSAMRIDGRPVLRVVDDGPGIPDAEHARVFDRFYRIASAHDDEKRLGSGLGLAIVKTIAARHDARVSLHTGATGHGLEVRVVFAHG